MDLLERQRLRVAGFGVGAAFVVAYAAGVAFGYSTAQRGVLFLALVLVVLGWYGFETVGDATADAGEP